MATDQIYKEASKNMPMRRFISPLVLISLLILISILPVQAAPVWNQVGNLNAVRTEHVVVSLKDGSVLVVGGNNGASTIYSSAEVYDPDTQTFTLLASGLNQARSSAQGVRLADGRVLICGGAGVMVGSARNTCEIYDHNTRTFTLTTNTMNAARAFHTMTLLDDGRVLIAGGSPDRGIGGTLNSVEIFDPGDTPVDGTFTLLGNTLSQPRTQHSAVRLRDGRVFIVSGSTAFSSQVTPTTDLFDPTGDTVTAGPTVPLANSLTGVGSLGLLDDGDVLLTNVFSVLSPNINYPNTYRFTPDTPGVAAYRRVADLNIPRFSTWPILRLTDGRFINICGRVPQPSGVLTNTTEIFDPVTDSWSAGPSTLFYRLGAGNKDIPFPLEGGSILIAGGFSGTSPTDFSLTTRAEVLVDTNTPVGSNITLTETFPQGVTLTVEFASVTQAGQTNIRLLPGAPALGTDFILTSQSVCPGEPDFFFDIGTSATFSSVVVTIDFSNDSCLSNLPPPQKLNLTLLHFDGMTPDPDDVTGQIIPAQNTIASTSLTVLSPFVLAMRRVLAADVSIDPNVLNAGTADNRGRSVVTVTISSVENATPSDIDVATVRLLGAAPVRSSVEDSALVLKFLRSDLDLSGLTPGQTETVDVTGNLTDGRPFQGSDTIRIR